MNVSEYDAISIHHDVDDISQIRSKLQNKILQGNLNPEGFRCWNAEIIQNETAKMLENFGTRDYIVNLGHGINKSTPEENMTNFVNSVHKEKFK